MKTLREYVDQLDEISRRDFLKGAGAAAATAALGGGAVLAKKHYDEKNPRVLSIKEANAVFSSVYCYALLQNPNAREVKGYNPDMIAQLKEQLMKFAQHTPYFVIAKGPEERENYDLIQVSSSQNVDSTKKLYQEIYNSFSTWEPDNKDFVQVVEKAPLFVNRLKVLNNTKEFQESQLEETAAESDVDRVIQLSREMRR